MAVFRVEKTKDFTIMSNHHLRNTELSLKAKGLLSLMLSLPEDWDYTTKGLAHICKDGVDSITTALKELERHGYLTRQRLRYDNGQLGDIEYTIHEQPVSTENTGLSPKRENPRQVKPEQAKPKQAEPEQENPAQLNTNPLKTKKSKKDKSITYPSIYPAEPEAANRTDGMDRIELIEAYREIIKENIEYDLLVLRYGRERLDEALELMLEVILSKRPYIRIAGDDFPREIVKSRFLKINSGHLEYVFDCIDKNTTKVGNIKAYLLAALYGPRPCRICQCPENQDHALGEIDLETYRTRKAVYDTELVQAKNVHAVITAQTKQIKSDYEIKLKQQEIVQEVGNANMLTKALIDRLINKVYVFPGDRIEIEYATQDFLETKESEKEV